MQGKDTHITSLMGLLATLTPGVSSQPTLGCSTGTPLSKEKQAVRRENTRDVVRNASCEAWCMDQAPVFLRPRHRDPNQTGRKYTALQASVHCS